MRLSLLTIFVYILLTIVATECFSQEATISYTNLQIILKASETYKLNATKLVQIAYVESRFNHSALRKNTNGTIDIGMFQINSIHWNTTCREFNVSKLEGNSMCAAKLLSLHKISASKDPNWVGRYHSKTPSRKLIYANKLRMMPPLTITLGDR